MRSGNLCLFQIAGGDHEVTIDIARGAGLTPTRASRSDRRVPEASVRTQEEGVHVTRAHLHH